MRQYFQAEIESAGELGPLLTGMLDAQQKILERVEVVEMRANGHDERLGELANAFPGGDTEGHRRFHQTQIEMLEERRRLRVAIQEKTISGLIWMLLVFTGLSVWSSIKNNIASVIK